MSYGIGGAFGDCDSTHQTPYLASLIWKCRSSHASHKSPSSILMRRNFSESRKVTFF